MRKREVKIWVDPDFRMELKKMAAEKNISILELTREMIKKDTNSWDNGKKKNWFDFKL